MNSGDIGCYKKIKVLGSGTYGKCYLVKNPETEEMCVIKQIDISCMK